MSKKKRVEMGRRRYRRGKGNQIFGVHNAKKWRRRKTHIGKNKKSDNSDENDVESKREAFQGRLQEKNENV